MGNEWPGGCVWGWNEMQSVLVEAQYLGGTPGKNKKVKVHWSDVLYSKPTCLSTISSSAEETDILSSR